MGIGYWSENATSIFSCFLMHMNHKYRIKWFHRVIAERCQKLIDGEIKNLMVFIPPQFGKSEIISRNFPAWALGKNPNLKIVGCSYSGDLANGFSTTIQRTIDSDKSTMCAATM